ncbi:TSUP family transporter [Streptomyces sp. NBC_01754]|uniref:TSUP family transporter n=1 Tax=Streptomyces sp. NBC_01754 TaxID=2975930 RepID=UPI002DDC1394|nr:TSUP family transporter [Streptomyces sp. NBC_01754]WSC90908.1 TSUP family transporter [Streptomyces sp. NBC_01754]WSC96598.1 TSUP family transporter [Streptomyces sp. NBC_01754]
MVRGEAVAGKQRLPKVLVVNAVLAGAVWAVWFLVWGPGYFDVLAGNWRVALTMVFGSLVGGGTSEGGGAIAFPVLTKVLAVPPDQARIFTFAIQSVGMAAASLSILLCRVPVERRVVFYGSAAGVPGVVLSATLLAPLVPLPTVRALFTMLLVALAVALFIQLRQRGYRRNAVIPVWTGRERGLVLVAGFAGGVVSGVVGVGENCVMFLLLVLLFRISEKVATPTTVVMMTVVSIAAFLTHVWVVGDFTGPVVGYWVAAAPVVAVGAPLGAWICTRLTPVAIRAVLFVLIGSELVSTLLLVPFTPGMVVASVLTLALFTGLCLVLVMRDGYAAPPVQDPGPGAGARVPVDAARTP